MSASRLLTQATGVAAGAKGFASAVESLIPASIWCVGRNYADHAKELGNSVPTTPMIFLKAGSCIVPSGPVRLPSFSEDVHFEVELAIQLGEDLTPARGAVAVDLTARDLQNKCKKQGHPWEIAKSFHESCPLGSFFSLQGVELSKLQLVLTVNGEVRQNGQTADMVFDVPTLVDYVKKHFPVRAGDLLLTGTPKGVGRILPGDHLKATVRNESTVLSEGAWPVQ